MDKDSKIFVSGHKGLVGSAIVKKLEDAGYMNIITRAHNELDLTIQKDTDDFFKAENPEYVFAAAAKVGGIQANKTYPADFTYENLMMECNVLMSAYRHNVKKLLFFGSSCIYPKNCPQPMKEEYLLSGSLEPSNEGYALAKLAGLKMCQYFNRQYGTDFIGVLPPNIYGPNDSFDLENSHVLSSLLRKVHEAKVHDFPSVEIWGTGKPLREFIYAGDLADACIFLMESYSGSEFVNTGTGRELSILELAMLIKKAVGYNGELVFNPDKPDGVYRKLLDSGRLRQLGWKPQIDLEEGIKLTYEWYLENIEVIKK